jgi:hypothetical protein
MNQVAHPEARYREINSPEYIQQGVVGKTPTHP